ncbi:hypothetical protein E4U52_006239 [Claviceps spartinae]|nr:hypothetical protein E4U52_006239 [Claviceps spartinae]
MEVVKFAKTLAEKNGKNEVVTNMIIRGPHRDHYYATTQDRFYESSEIDLDNLNKIPIDSDTIWPRYSAQFLQAPSPVPQDSYVKEINLCFYELRPEGKEKNLFSDLILHEIEAYKLLRRHPHPNIVEYRGCVVEDDRITGICLAKYKTTLCKKIEDSTPLNKDIFLAGIECGIRHLHSLGLVHNDISPDNVMLDELDRPVLIDFDCWGRDGQKFAPDMKKSALEWSINALSKLQEFLYDPSSGKPLSKSTSANSSQTTKSSTKSSSGPQDISDAFGTTAVTPIEGSGQNTTTPPPPKEKEKKYKF